MFSASSWQYNSEWVNKNCFALRANSFGLAAVSVSVAIVLGVFVLIFVFLRFAELISVVLSCSWLSHCCEDFVANKMFLALRANSLGSAAVCVSVGETE